MPEQYLTAEQIAKETGGSFNCGGITMSKFTSHFTSAVLVEFSDDQLAKELFIDSDWKETFYSFCDLQDVAGHISWGFQAAPAEWSGKYKSNFKFIEGFGDFFRNGYSDVYVCEYEGGLSISCTQILDLELDFVEEGE